MSDRPARPIAGPADAVRSDPARADHARRLLSQARRASIDRLAGLAARLTGAPHAQVSMLTDQQVVAGGYGLGDEAATPLEASLCTVTVARGEPLVVEDAAADARVSSLPPVAARVVGAYLGIPVVVGGHAVGALCVYGRDPRRWTGDDVEVLSALAETVAAELAAGGVAADAEQTAVRLALGYDAASIGSFDWNLVTDELQWDDRLKELFGYTDATFVPHIDSFSRPLHPDDRARVDAAIAEAVASCGEYGTEFRILLPDGTIRWIAARGRVLCGVDGRPERMLGAGYDTSATREMSDRLARVLETMASAFFSLDRDWRFTYVNAQAERLLGRGRDELLGSNLWDEFTDALDTTFEDHYRHAAATGEPAAFEAFYPPLATWFEVRAWPGTEGLSVFFHDISARVAAEEERAKAHQRLEILSAAGTQLAATLDVEEILARLGDLLLPRFGSWLAVAVRSDVAALLDEAESAAQDSDLRIVHVAAPAPELRERLAGALVGGRFEPGARGLPALAEAGRHVLVPLRSRDRVIGQLVVGEPAGAAADAGLLADIAVRAGVALDNAVLYRAERQFGVALQHLLLPARLPQPPGVPIAARYLAGTAGRDIGGDFYIAEELAGGRLLLVMGDVMGHGVRAAARMGQLRAIVTAYALDGEPPDRVLARVARRADDLLDVSMATIAVLVYDPAARRLTAASAGHPPPLLAAPGRPPAFMDLPPGPPIGLGPAAYTTATADVAPGTTIVLYTDGLVENRGEPIDAGLERLRDALTGVRLPPDQVCDHVLRRLGRVGGGSDDVALLVCSHT